MDLPSTFSELIILTASRTLMGACLPMHEGWKVRVQGRTCTVLPVPGRMRQSAHSIRCNGFAVQQGTLTVWQQHGLGCCPSTPPLTNCTT